jgi:hypothetical protein
MTDMCQQLVVRPVDLIVVRLELDGKEEEEAWKEAPGFPRPRFDSPHVPQM